MQSYQTPGNTNANASPNAAGPVADTNEQKSSSSFKPKKLQIFDLETQLAALKDAKCTSIELSQQKFMILK